MNADTGKFKNDRMVCLTTPAAPPSTGPTLPTQQIAAYSALLLPAVSTDTSGAATRTVTTTYLSDGRTDTVRTTTTGLSGSTPVTGTKTIYDTTTGQVLETRQLAPGTLTETGNETTYGYDSWGRQLTYSTIENGVTDRTDTSYDPAGRTGTVTSVVGGASYTTTYRYDGTKLDGTAGVDVLNHAEHRGLPTLMTVTRSSGQADLSFAAAYDAAGQLVQQNLPGGIVQTTDYDSAGEPVGRSYLGDVTDPDTAVTSQGSWLSWAQDNDVLGRVRHEWTPDGAAFTGPDAGSNMVTDPGDALGYDRSYGYDQAGRLVKVIDRTVTTTGLDVTDPTTTGTQAPCTTRTYGFDRNGNRVLRGTSTLTDGTCPSSGATVVRHSFDTADRLVSGSDGTAYSYDLLGRATSLPSIDTPNNTGALSIGYFDNDLVASLDQNGSKTTFALDTDGRRKTATTAPSAGGAATDTLVRHYTDGSDNPGWTTDTTSAGTVTTRYAEALGGDLGAEVNGDGSTTLPLPTLHGDVVTTAAVPSTGNASGIAGWSDYDEYGNPRTPNAAAAVGGSVGYGWLGGKQRSTTNTGLMLMGLRVYNPVTGQFTSPDPVAGGNDTAYAYPNDPINSYDLDGRFGWKKFFKITLAVTSLVCTVCFVASVAWSTWDNIDDARHGHIGRALFNTALDVAPGGFGRGAKLLAKSHAGRAALAKTAKNYFKKRGMKDLQRTARHLAEHHRVQAERWAERGHYWHKRLDVGAVATQSILTWRDRD